MTKIMAANTGGVIIDDTFEGASPSSNRVSEPANATTNTTIKNNDPDLYHQAGGYDATSIGENMLNSYRNYTYHWRWVVCSTDALAKLTTNPENYLEIINNLDQNNQLITIAESGVTGYTIDEVHMNLSLTGDGINTVSTGFQLDVSEPLGTSMIEKMMLAAATLRIQDWKCVPYHLILTFKGYDLNGKPVEIPIKKVWSVLITDVKTTLSEGATKYSIRMTQYSQLGFAVENNRLKKLITLTASNVGEVFDQLAEKLRPDPTEASDFFSIQHSYEFVFHGEENDNIRGWQLTPPSDEMFKANKSKAWSDVKVTGTQVTFGAGASINDIINVVLSCTKEAQTKMGIKNTDVNLSKSAKNQGDTQSKTADDSFVDLTKNTFQAPKVTCDISLLGYDEWAGEYIKKFTYHIHLWDTSTVCADPRQIERTADATEALKRRYELGRRLNRRYDYLYTGNNTEILSLDLRMDTLYTNSFALMGGIYTSALPTDGYALDPKKVYVRIGSLQKLYTSNINRIKEIDQSLSETKEQDSQSQQLLKQEKEQLVSKNTNILSTMQTLKSANNVDNIPPVEGEDRYRNEVETYYDSNRPPVDIVNARSARLQQFAASNKKITYAENLSGDLESAMLWFSSQNKGNYMRSRFSDDGRKAETEYVTAIETRYDRGRHLMGSLLNQVYTTSSDLVSIELEIRGDPYWIGTDVYEQLAYTNKNRKRGYRNKTSSGVPVSDEPHLIDGYPNFSEAQHMFLLTFNTPKERNESGITPMNGPSIFENVYWVQSIACVFRGGHFTQTLKASRDTFSSTALIQRIKELETVKDGTYTANAQRVSPTKKTISSTPTTPSTTPTGNDYESKRYDFIKSHEGEKTHVYTDTKGNKTVGVGFNMDAAGAEDRFINATGTDTQFFNDVKSGRADITKEQSKALFDVSVADAEKVVSNRTSGVTLNDDQRISLVSMAYNNPSLIGPNLRSALTSGDTTGVTNEILYNSNASDSTGIATRRYKEAALFTRGSNAADTTQVATIEDYNKYMKTYKA